MSESFQERCARWHRTKFPARTPDQMLVKLMEEVGEIARARVGEMVGRPGRGDVGDEAAQVVLVLASFIGIHYSHRDLLADAELELSRHEVALQGPGLWRDTTPCCDCGSRLATQWAEDASEPECAHCHHVCAHLGHPFVWLPKDGASG